MWGQNPDIDLVRVQDVNLSGKDDPTVLDWAAKEKRIVLTHDVATMITFAYQRIQVGLSISYSFYGRDTDIYSFCDRSIFPVFYLNIPSV
ncbi:MAG: DUF5615 family PIN-like protein [Crocosphaera sp.]|nr:DUF5615 family PIN-like protein [Crocosphaera sp.]